MGRRILCACCGKPGTYGGFGWRSTCYSRWANAGRPEDGPPAPYSGNRNGPAAALAAIRGRTEFRKHLFAALARDPDLTNAEIAERLGVSKRTAERYSAQVRPTLRHLAPATATTHRGGTVSRTTEPDPMWEVNRIRAWARERPSAGREGFEEKLGPVPYWHLTDAEMHDVRIRTLGLLIGGGDDRPAVLHETLQALGIGAVPDQWIADDPVRLDGAA